ncbi:MAG: Rrf2 family transcriptional regulator [Actinobacteria bacterium]|nr:Rrf2 family transcriptional regulator [Actinomycetota bacterium]MCB8997860.1 Rrf2 family transcriptional regulator [Actinomycetota bacterium]MCB9414246.1 Rrf2 family transcriptional regulator [Actinomycetota bacterium]MCB9423990.1 Rrf2 family transcriptional regulator [Actinomycetota bacterium]HRY09693.1 Rrf2 family transcriptional regulator [Candidatus Nanopelagicales bacterium]
MTYPLGVWQAMLACAYIADKARVGDEDFISTARLAADLGLPTPSAAALLRRLTAAGLIDTREGARGGVRLAREPGAITLDDIVGAMQQARPLFATDHRIEVSGPTPARRQKQLRAALGSAEEALHEALREVTLADLAT